jgi:hypothetical protein
MLASITPLGERSRGFSWRLTASAFAIGAVGASVLTGAGAGAIGSLAPGEQWRRIAGLVIVLSALAIDIAPVALPTTRRQVNEDWMARYRGWVYGVAFGAQLGVGVVTVVTSAAVYAAALGALVSGTAWSGAIIGGAFGAVRASSLVAARGARDPAGLAGLQHRLDRGRVPARRAVVAGELLAAALLIASLG